ncbi:MAG TPA: DinB family protein [Candidatus Acidoferrales bacterium]|jgi:uncharacterized damage-inducible protein DinB|nr:DinB family protein [Candidatus Acidoferrales bacterium]
MAINQALLGEFDHEMANTRKSLERVPDAKFDWKPHAKSMTMGKLAAHIAFIPHWGKLTLESANFDVNPAGGQQARPPELKTKAEVLAFFDKNVPEARAAIAAASDQAMMTPWTLLNGGKTVFTLPRIGVLRAMIMNHMIHHRAQLGVYLRLNDVPVPSIYGPSADEAGM